MPPASDTGRVSGAQPSGVELGGKRTRVVVTFWRVVLWNARWLGYVIRWVLVDARGVSTVAALAPAVYLWFDGKKALAGAAAGLWFLTLLSLAAWHARNRVIVDDFSQTGTSGKDTQETGPTVDLGDLLRVELSRLGDLFRVVGDRRAVWSGLAHQPALDATLAVDDLVKTLQGAISADAKASLGPVSVPLAPIVSLGGRLIQAPRLSGSLHRDGDLLILTAQTNRRGGLSWRVPPEPAPPASTVEAPTLSGLVEELALRVYTDLALGRAVRWESSKLFVAGLRRFRSCLRTPKDRKVNLKHTETSFLLSTGRGRGLPARVLQPRCGLHGTARARRRGGAHSGIANASQCCRVILRPLNREGPEPMGGVLRVRPDTVRVWAL